MRESSEFSALKKTSLAFATLFLVLCSGSSRAVWADGPHWYIPEPPDDEYDLIELEEATKKRFQTAMQISTRKDFLEEVARVCIRYLREYESYVAAPDSPEPWHSREGREAMAEYAVDILRILAREDKVADLAVEAYAEQIRFRDDVAAGRVSAEMKALIEAAKDLNKTLGKWSEAFENVKEKDTRGRGKEMAAVRNEWVSASAKYDKALKACENELPRSFIKNMTGDIPFIQDGATWRLRSALLVMGWPVIKPLQKLQKHPNPKVVREAAALLKDLGYRIKNPQSVPLTIKRVKDLLKQLTNPRSPNAREALKIMQKYGEAILPPLLSIAREMESPLRGAALGSLYSLTGQLFGTKLDKWEAYIEKRLAKARKRNRKTEQPVPAPDHSQIRSKPVAHEVILAEEDE